MISQIVHNKNMALSKRNKTQKKRTMSSFSKIKEKYNTNL